LVDEKVAWLVPMACHGIFYPNAIGENMHLSCGSLGPIFIKALSIFTICLIGLYYLRKNRYFSIHLGDTQFMHRAQLLFFIIKTFGSIFIGEMKGLK
jgi:hypothetical protein